MTGRLDWNRRFGALRGLVEAVEVSGHSPVPESSLQGAQGLWASGAGRGRARG